jgi:hypothetical protein
MKNSSTGRETQRTDFVTSLYSSLRKKTKIAMDNHNQIISMASSYVQDGLAEKECIELLIINQGLSRTAAERYVSMVKSSSEAIEETTEENEYSFQFEDSHGNVLSSFDVGKIVTASNEKEAMDKADTIMQGLEEVTILSVSKIS